MATPRLGIVTLVTFLILLSLPVRTRVGLEFYVFTKLIKFYGKIVCLLFCWYFLAFEFIIIFL